MVGLGRLPRATVLGLQWNVSHKGLTLRFWGEDKDMPKGLEYEAVIVELTRLQNSDNGNPRYRITFEDGQTAISKTDGAVGYDLQNLRLPVRVTIKTDPNGKVRSADPIA